MQVGVPQPPHGEEVDQFTATLIHLRDWRQRVRLETIAADESTPHVLRHDGEDVEEIGDRQAARDLALAVLTTTSAATIVAHAPCPAIASVAPIRVRGELSAVVEAIPAGTTNMGPWDVAIATATAVSTIAAVTAIAVAAASAVAAIAAAFTSRQAQAGDGQEQQDHAHDQPQHAGPKEQREHIDRYEKNVGPSAQLDNVQTPSEVIFQEVDAVLGHCCAIASALRSEPENRAGAIPQRWIMVVAQGPLAAELQQHKGTEEERLPCVPDPVPDEAGKEQRGSVHDAHALRTAIVEDLITVPVPFEGRLPTAIAVPTFHRARCRSNECR
mmetsp:Transcript_98159/g.282214  ORF Transcript_98159/g.282214 Transcript_98159/m.282214 type:complete len:328 (-) Transcript_98159:395-1378(-)